MIVDWTSCWEEKQKSMGLVYSIESHLSNLFQILFFLEFTSVQKKKPLKKPKGLVINERKLSPLKLGKSSATHGQEPQAIVKWLWQRRKLWWTDARLWPKAWWIMIKWIRWTFNFQRHIRSLPAEKITEEIATWNFELGPIWSFSVNLTHKCRCLYRWSPTLARRYCEGFIRLQADEIELLLRSIQRKSTSWQESANGMNDLSGSSMGKCSSLLWKMRPPKTNFGDPGLHARIFWDLYGSRF